MESPVMYLAEDVILLYLVDVCAMDQMSLLMLEKVLDIFIERTIKLWHNTNVV